MSKMAIQILLAIIPLLLSQGAVAQLDMSGKVSISESAPSQLQDGVEDYVRKNYAAALKKLQPLAKKNDAIAQFCVGKMYMQGHGVKPDYKIGIAWLQKSAKQGNRDAQAFLGFVYYYGIGVKQSYTESISWSRKAADQGSSEAQHNLGWMYEKGQGVPPDPVEAYMWFKLATNLGEEGARVKMKALEPSLTQQQIAEAATRVRVWMAQHD